MNRKIPAAAFVLSLIAAVLVTAVVMVLALGSVYRHELAGAREIYDEAAGKLEAYGPIAEKLYEIDALYKKFYPGELDEDSLLDCAVKGYVAGSGDRYGFYYNAEEAKVLEDDIAGETEGIGVSVIYNADVGAVEIISVGADTPSDEAGLIVGDLIAYIVNDDGSEEAVADLGYEAAITRLRGPSGTEAHFIAFRPDGKGAYTEKEYKITRTRFEAESVMWHVYSPDETIGVIKITGFDQKTPGQFKTAVSELRAAGCEKLIFDVRYNPGGDKDAVCDVLDFLLPEGPTMRTVDKEGNYTVIAESDADFLDMPMAVVVNGSTASAGELFTAALKDYGAAKVIGTTTFGKGTMQSIRPLSDGETYLKITTAYYCPPKSENYDGVGITPDVEIELDEALLEKNIYKVTDEEDNQLRAAADTFKNK